jgi:hypothetical protein
MTLHSAFSTRQAFHNGLKMNASSDTDLHENNAMPMLLTVADCVLADRSSGRGGAVRELPHSPCAWLDIEEAYCEVQKASGARTMASCSILCACCRCFVHVDYAERMEPEHKIERCAWLICAKRAQHRLQPRPQGRCRDLNFMHVLRNLQLGRGINEPHDSVKHQVPTFESHSSSKDIATAAGAASG